jgi:hypothetical protein
MMLIQIPTDFTFAAGTAGKHRYRLIQCSGILMKLNKAIKGLFFNGQTFHPSAFQKIRIREPYFSIIIERHAG